MKSILPLCCIVTTAFTSSALHAQSSVTPKPPIPINFTLKTAGFVTLVIEDSTGHRVRNLISETPFPAGTNTAWWDGLDDTGRDLDAAAHGIFHIPGKLVSAGRYQVRGLVRPAINMSYQSTPYTNGQPPWHTADRSSQWLANHTAPSTVLFVPAGAAPIREGKPTSAGGQVLVGSFVSEGGSGLAWLDMNGRKLNGQVWLGGVWTAASHLARDEGDKPVAGVYAYAGAGWKGDKYNGNVAELRLHELVSNSTGKALKDTRMGTGEDRAVLTPTFKVPKAPAAPDNMNASDSTDSNPLGGLAVHNGLLVASLPKNDLLLFVDAASHKSLGTTTLEKPGNMLFDNQGRLLVFSGNKLLRYQLAADPTQLATPQTLIGTGLEEPQQIAHDKDGNLYISDWGKSHQVKVFSPEGQFLRAIGKTGKPAIGAYDPNHMNHPNGISLDAQGRLWVAETDKTPKRISVWAADGKLAAAYYGPAAYGGGGWLDTEDKTRFFYSDDGGAMEIKVDPITGSSVPVNVYWRPELDKLGMLGKYTGTGPQTPLHVDGRTYLTNAYNSNPTGGTTSAQIWALENNVALPVASIGRVSDSAGKLAKAFEGDEFKAPIAALNAPNGELLFVWSERNGDGKMQPNEVNFIKPSRPTYQNTTLIGGVSVQSDLSVVLAYAGDQALRFTPQGFTSAGAPIYNAAKPEVLVDGVQRTSSSGGGQALTSKNGWTILTTAPKPYASQGFAGVKNGQPLWSYPSLWPGLHASHNAPKPAAPGQVIGSTRLLGNTISPKGSDAGEMWAINGNKGTIYLFTMDGLFVTTLFKDSRDASWSFPEAKQGMSVNNASTGEENFWPTISQTSDGGIYVQTNGSLIKVDGLEGVKRLPDVSINVTQAQLQQSQTYFAQIEAARQSEKATGPLTIAMLPNAPVVDGKLDEWAKADWITIDTRVENFNNWSHKNVNTEAALAVSGDKLYAAFKTDDPKILNNSGESLQNLFKTGGALDLMIGTNPNADPKRNKAAEGDIRLFITRVKNQTTAMLYRPIAPNTATEPVQFASPLRTLKMDGVDNVSDVVALASGVITDEKTKLSQGFFEFSIPLATLGLNPSAGQTLKGDVGILRGNGFQTLQRVYWSNKATGLVSDLPSEAELTPQLWGQFVFKQ